MITKLQFEVVSEWNQKRSLRNFARLYRHGFNYEWVLWRPIWRIWRIFRNTVLTNNYVKLEERYRNYAAEEDTND